MIVELEAEPAVRPCACPPVRPGRTEGQPVRRTDEGRRTGPGEEHKRASVHGHNVDGPGEFVHAARGAGQRPHPGARLHGRQRVAGRGVRRGGRARRARGPDRRAVAHRPTRLVHRRRRDHRRRARLRVRHDSRRPHPDGHHRRAGLRHECQPGGRRSHGRSDGLPGIALSAPSGVPVGRRLGAPRPTVRGSQRTTPRSASRSHGLLGHRHGCPSVPRDPVRGAAGAAGAPSLALPPMVVPSLDTEHPGIRVIAEVASVLQAGLASGEALHGVVSALRRGLNLRRCRLWLRTPDGTRYAPVTTGDDVDAAGYLPPVAEWVRHGPHRENVPGGCVIRLPLIHDDEPLGALEVVIPTGRYEGIAHDVVVVVARILAPMIAATELSQDLASEVALRTHEMEAQRSFAAQIIDSLPVGLYVIDRAYRIRAWNRKRETGMQGVSREDAVGREIFDVLDRQPRDLLKREFARVFDTGELQQVEMESQASGEVRHYRITKIPMHQDGGDISHVITIGEDITEWRQAQQRLTETEKLAAVGQLAAGVMHEINNPLATILACCEALALRTADLAPPDRHGYDEYLKIIDTEVQRCRRIVESLLDFSRPKGGDKKPTDVNGVVERTLFLLKHHARFKRLNVVRQLATGLPTVLADHERLIQSFMALMLNAMDAMDSRGTLTVRSRINPDRADEILLEFIDTGTGIKREDLPKIFEPFFTTKPQGRGTGLGLSICYGIIAEHRGRIDVESQVGVGSNFKVYLPTG